MKKFFLFAGLLAFVLLSGCTASQISQALDEARKAMEEGASNPLTTAEVSNGLKQALEKGVAYSADKGSQVNGFLGNPAIKIPFPEDVKRVEDKLRQIGLGRQVDKFVETMNRGAEEAAKEAKPIFIRAVRNMTIQDAWGILKGGQNAATDYLQAKTTQELYVAFKPVVKKNLDKTQATKYYGDIVNKYNLIPGVKKVNPDLEDYATQKAIEGLFYLIAEEERKIRENPVERTTELLKRVFDKNNWQ